MDCSQPGPSVRGILQARMLEGVPFPRPGHLPDPGIEPKSLMSPALAGGFFTTSATWEVSPVHFKFGGYEDHPQDSATCGFGDSIRF